MQTLQKNDSFMSKSDSNEKFFNSECSTFFQEELFDVMEGFLKKKSVLMDIGLQDLLDSNIDSFSDFQTTPVISFNKLSGETLGEISELSL